MAIQTFPVTLEESFMLSPKVKHFVFRTELETAFTYKPGQFITVHFELDGKMLRRSYSVANAPKNDNRIEFAAGYVDNGPGTELLFNLKPGDTLNINGPFGRLVLREPAPKRCILVATSTGVTPYRAMMPALAELLQQDADFQVEILQGVAHANEVLYADEFLSFAKQYDRVGFKACLSRENEHTLQAHETKGYVQHQFGNLLLNPDTDTVYLCGNPAMIDDSFAQLKDMGFAMQQIIREKYISN